MLTIIALIITAFVISCIVSQIYVVVYYFHLRKSSRQQKKFIVLSVAGSIWIIIAQLNLFFVPDYSFMISEYKWWYICAIIYTISFNGACTALSVRDYFNFQISKT